MRLTSHILLPNGSKMNTLKKSVVGGGYGAVLLDGGQGGQSSYYSVENYLDTTNKPKSYPSSGKGLDDKISSKLRNLNITPPTSKPKMKNITLSL